MITLEMDRYNLKVKVKCVEPEDISINNKEFLTTLDKFVNLLDFYESVEVSIIKNNSEYEI